MIKEISLADGRTVSVSIWYSGTVGGYVIDWVRDGERWLSGDTLDIHDQAYVKRRVADLRNDHALQLIEEYEAAMGEAPWNQGER